ncbi:MAG TPA: hypothetical protein VJ809_17190 [Pirellulales bacterium]|nr:hypothetical protein [Pirellulales bacterium]
MRKCAIAVVAALAMSGAFAEEAAIVGFGAQDSSCGDWIKARRNNEKALQSFAVVYVQGFLSGLNMAHSKGEASAMINLPSASVIEALLDKQCASSPTTGVAMQAIGMFFALEREQKRVSKSN